MQSLRTWLILERGEPTCEYSVLLAGLTPADFERRVKNLSETQVTHSAGDWVGVGDNKQMRDSTYSVTSHPACRAGPEKLETVFPF